MRACVFVCLFVGVKKEGGGGSVPLAILCFAGHRCAYAAATSLLVPDSDARDHWRWWWRRWRLWRGCGGVSLGGGWRVIAVLVEEGRRPLTLHLTHDLTVGGRRALHAGAGGTLARVAAGGPRACAAATVHVNVYEVAVENGPVGRRAHRGPAQLQLLLGVPQLQGTGPLVGRQLLAVRQTDGRWQVDVLLQVGVGRLEAAESVPLHKGRWVEALLRTRPVHHLQTKERDRQKEREGQSTRE